MIELEYLTKNKKGFSLDNIKSSDLGKEVCFFFIGEKQQKYIMVLSRNNFTNGGNIKNIYGLTIFKEDRDSFLYSKGAKTIDELKEVVKKELSVLGFRDKEDLDVKVNNTLDLGTSIDPTIIINEINSDNGTNHKIEVLKKYQEDEQLKRLLKMTYDSVAFTYGVTMKNIEENEKVGTQYTLENILDILEAEFCTRKITGNAALERLQELYDNTSLENKDILSKVLDRDLKLNIGKRVINKVFKNLIVKPLYMRCGIFTQDKEVNGKIKKGTAKDINFPALIQLKADGTYREVTVDSGKVSYVSRSGEPYDYPSLTEGFSKLPDGKYVGELTISGITNRAEGNGIINSDNIPGDRLIIELWDYITLKEYTDVSNKISPITPYINRWNNLSEIIKGNQRIKLIESYEVNTLQEALEKVTAWMNDGLEGGILKDKKGMLKDGTSKHQLKLKLEIDADVRITGFTEGKKGTAREKTFGAIMFETDDGKVKGQTSGLTDAQLNDYNSRREELIGMIMVVQFNDITKGRNNDYYALSHPRHIEIRTDKSDTDTYERIMELKDMAMNLS